MASFLSPTFCGRGHSLTSPRQQAIAKSETKHSTVFTAEVQGAVANTVECDFHIARLCQSDDFKFVDPIEPTDTVGLCISTSAFRLPNSAFKQSDPGEIQQVKITGV
jgi:hypothetical protein